MNNVGEWQYISAMLGLGIKNFGFMHGVMDNEGTFAGWDFEGRLVGVFDDPGRVAKKA